MAAIMKLNSAVFDLVILGVFIVLRGCHSYQSFVNEFYQEDEHMSSTDTLHTFKKYRDFMPRRNKIGNRNVNDKNRKFMGYGDGEVTLYEPGQPAPTFELWHLGGKAVYPSSLFTNKSTLIHVFNSDSAFLECLWNSDDALSPLLTEDASNNTVFIFIPRSAELKDKYGAVWMQNRLASLARRMKNVEDVTGVMQKFIFSIFPLNKLGNWIPSVLQQWQCVDHLCGIDQAVIQSNTTAYPRVVKRLNARYDWIPSPESMFGNQTLALVQAGDGCQTTSSVNHSLALVSSGGCSVLDKLQNMSKSGARGVVLFADRDTPIQEVSCQGSECNVGVSIPAVTVEWADFFISNSTMNITFQNTPSENFFMAVDREGNLAEVGWFLYPTMKFLIWQSQWFDYKAKLLQELSAPQMSVSVFKDRVMQGHDGVVVNYTLPDLKDMKLFRSIQLDVSLSCPGTKDTSCAHWDRIMTLYVCCNTTSPLCGMELGRWITPFRRRIGHWLTDISPLLPLLGDGQCTFTMKTDWYAMPWIPSLSIVFTEERPEGDLYPSEAFVLYEPGATFNKSYNSNFKPYNFTVPKDVGKVEIYAVITGHGSDENGCGEFCVTSHHFNVNDHVSNITFSEAGTPLGCADQVSTGVEPNEHGTWLYGRNGWCDGRNVFPWVIDVTEFLNPSGEINQIKYFGWYNGTDPDPKHNPGLIVIYSYVIYYRKFEIQH